MRDDLVVTAESEWRRAFLEAALDCVVVMDSHGLVVEFNSAAQQTFGYTREEAVGHSLADLIVPPSLRDRHRAGLQRYVESRQSHILRQRIEITAMRRTGAEFMVELTIVPFESAQGLHFVGYLRDLTERIQAQEALKRRSAVIEALNQIPAAVAQAPSVEEALHVCLQQVGQFAGWQVGHAYLVAPDKKSLVTSRQWVAETNVPVEEFRRDSDARHFRRGEGLPGRVWASLQPEWDADLSASANFPRAESARKAGLRSGLAVPVVAAGELFAVLEFFSSRAEIPEQGILDVLAGVGMRLGPLIERRAAEDRLRAAYASLQEAEQVKARLLSVTAHEISAPLTPIGLILFKLKAMNPRPEGVDMLERNFRRLEVLVRDMQDAARVQPGNLRLTPTAFDLGGEAARAAQAASQSPSAKEVTVKAVQEGPLPVLADPVRIGQVLDNLLSNAVKFTRRGIVDVRARRDGEWAVVEVTDSGMGMAPEELGKLFRPFSRLAKTSEVPGTGLGLYISQTIAQASGGTLGAHSAGEGKGSTLTLRLPLA